MIHVAVVNNSGVADYIVNRWVNAVQRQVTEHFEPIYGYGAELIFFPHGKKPKAKGYWFLYLEQRSTVDDAVGYHDQTPDGKPISYVFVQDCVDIGQIPSVVLSHEVLELLANPFCDQAALGPNKKRVVVAYEACDAVQSDIYSHFGLMVSNFVYPNYFGLNDPPPYDHLRKIKKPFEVRPGGYEISTGPNRVWRASDLKAMPGNSHTRAARYTRRSQSLQNASAFTRVLAKLRRS